jgi:hypothetical protein
METQAAADRFMKTLQQAEADGDVQPLVELFAEGSKLHALTERREHGGPSGAEQFWSEYLGQFSEVKSEFGHVATEGNLANCEWVSRGKLDGGRDIEYSGVSLLEFDENGKLSRFRTYYDSAAFLDVKSD